jgi:hypothetical protein
MNSNVTRGKEKRSSKRKPRLARPGLPLDHLVKHRVSDRAHELGRGFDPVELAKVALDLPDAHPPAYVETILSSNPGKRRWYLAISCGSKLPRRSRGISRSSLPVSMSTVFLL